MPKAHEKEDVDTEDQSTEDKAKDIGKKVDAIKTDKDEPIPDYEITEEGAKDEKVDVKSDKKDDDKEDDERIGKQRDDREDHRKLTNREKRQLKKKRVAEKFDAKDALIRQQQEQLNAMAGRLNEVDGRLSNYDQAQLQQTYNESLGAYNSAKEQHKAAFANGDSEKATAAMEQMYVAKRRMDDLEAIHARQQNTPRQQVQPKQNDPRLVSKATEWANKNTWFKPGAEDDDSAIADTIAAKLVKEGFDPKTDDYWDELDERLEKKGIGQVDDEDDVDPPQRREAKRRSPPVGGGGNGRGDIGSGKTSVTLPTAYINALKEQGYWDQPEKRNKMIKRYIDGLRERGEA